MTYGCSKRGCGREGGWRDFPTHQAIRIDMERYELCAEHFGEYKSWSLVSGRRLDRTAATEARVPKSQHVKDFQDSGVYWVDEGDYWQLRSWLQGRERALQKHPTETM